VRSSSSVNVIRKGAGIGTHSGSLNILDLIPIAYLTSGAKVSMDGRGRCHDNIFIERLWRFLKYELIYLKAFEDGAHLNQDVKAWFDWYNQNRLHQSLNYATPDEVYFRAG
jgi:transposase InsO family protein